MAEVSDGQRLRLCSVTAGIVGARKGGRLVRRSSGGLVSGSALEEGCVGGVSHRCRTSSEVWDNCY